MIFCFPTKIDWINVDVYDVDGYTALYLASLNKHKNCVRVLLEDAGAKPNEYEV